MNISVQSPKTSKIRFRGNWIANTKYLKGDYIYVDSRPGFYYIALNDGYSQGKSLARSEKYEPSWELSKLIYDGPIQWMPAEVNLVNNRVYHGSIPVVTADGRKVFKAGAVAVIYRNWSPETVFAVGETILPSYGALVDDTGKTYGFLCNKIVAVPDWPRKFEETVQDNQVLWECRVSYGKLLPAARRAEPVFQELVEVMDYLQLHEDIYFNDVLHKFNDRIKVRKDTLDQIIGEFGYVYIAKALTLEEPELRALVSYMGMIHAFKGHQSGLDLIFEIMQIQYHYEEWWQQAPKGEPDTWALYLDLDLERAAADIVNRIVTFTRSYVYPVLTKFEITYRVDLVEVLTMMAGFHDRAFEIDSDGFGTFVVSSTGGFIDKECGVTSRIIAEFNDVWAVNETGLPKENGGVRYAIRTLDPNPTLIRINRKRISEESKTIPDFHLMPVVIDDTGHIKIGLTTSISGNVLTNDYDPNEDENPLSIVAVNNSFFQLGKSIKGSNGGDLIINKDGSWGFSLGADFATLDPHGMTTTSATYRVTNGVRLATGQLTINVYGSEYEIEEPEEPTVGSWRSFFYAVDSMGEFFGTTDSGGWENEDPNNIITDKIVGIAFKESTSVAISANRIYIKESPWALAGSFPGFTFSKVISWIGGFCVVGKNAENHGILLYSEDGHNWVDVFATWPCTGTEIPPTPLLDVAVVVNPMDCWILSIGEGGCFVQSNFIEEDGIFSIQTKSTVWLDVNFLFIKNLGMYIIVAGTDNQVWAIPTAPPFIDNLNNAGSFSVNYPGGLPGKWYDAVVNYPHFYLVGDQVVAKFKHNYDTGAEGTEEISGNIYLPLGVKIASNGDNLLSYAGGILRESNIVDINRPISFEPLDSPSANPIEMLAGGENLSPAMLLYVNGSHQREEAGFADLSNPPWRSPGSAFYPSPFATHFQGKIWISMFGGIISYDPITRIKSQPLDPFTKDLIPESTFIEDGFQTPDPIRKVGVVGGLLYVYTYSGKIVYTANGIDWSAVGNIPSAYFMNSPNISFNGSLYLVATGQKVFTSTDLLTWSSYTYNFSYGGGPTIFYGTTYGNGIFVLLGTRGWVGTSTTGLAGSWTRRDHLHGSNLMGIIFNGVRFIAHATNSPNVSYSSDCINWTLIDLKAHFSILEDLNSINGRMTWDGVILSHVMISYVSRKVYFFTSIDGITWNLDLSNIPNIDTQCGAKVGNKYYSIGDSGLLFVQDEDRTVDVVIPFPTKNVRSYAYFYRGEDLMHIAVGEDFIVNPNNLNTWNTPGADQIRPVVCVYDGHFTFDGMDYSLMDTRSFTGHCFFIFGGVGPYSSGYIGRVVVEDGEEGDIYITNVTSLTENGPGGWSDGLKVGDYFVGCGTRGKLGVFRHSASGFPYEYVYSFNTEDEEDWLFIKEYRDRLLIFSRENYISCLKSSIADPTWSESTTLPFPLKGVAASSTAVVGLAENGNLYSTSDLLEWSLVSEDIWTCLGWNPWLNCFVAANFLTTGTSNGGYIWEVFSTAYEFVPTNLPVPNPKLIPIAKKITPFSVIHMFTDSGYCFRLDDDTFSCNPEVVMQVSPDYYNYYDEPYNIKELKVIFETSAPLVGIRITDDTGDVTIFEKSSYSSGETVILPTETRIGRIYLTQIFGVSTLISDILVKYHVDEPF